MDSSTKVVRSACSSSWDYTFRCMKVRRTNSVRPSWKIAKPCSGAILRTTRKYTQRRLITSTTTNTHTFSIWSVCIGRFSQLPKYAVGVDRPTQSNIKNEWTHYSDQHLSKRAAAPVRCDNRQFFLHLSILVEVVNDNLEMFYAPRERTNVRRLIDRYRKYHAWYKLLPDSLRLNSESPPH